MMKKCLIFISSFAFAITLGCSLDAATNNGRKTHIPIDNIPVYSMKEHYQRGAEYYNAKKWDLAAKEFRIVATHFSKASYGQDANYYLGVSYFNLNELDLANDAFSKYLQGQTNPQYFQDAIEYKFAIAERFRAGEGKRFLGFKQLPKWGSGHEIALGAYDEVIAAMPSHDVAAQALYGKGCLLWVQKDYRDSIEAFQTLIRRFPKCELAPDCFLNINLVYLDQCQKEFQNPDLLALAEINLRKFEEQFPGEERLERARCELNTLKEIYAKGMYDTAYFYERINQPLAAVIYYQKAILDFPETSIAQRCRNRLSSFCPQALEDLNNLPQETGEDPLIDDVPSDIDFMS